MNREQDEVRTWYYIARSNFMDYSYEFQTNILVCCNINMVILDETTNSILPSLLSFNRTSPNIDIKMLGKDFQKYWAGSDDRSAWEGFKGAFKSKEPLKYRIVQARYKLGSMINRLDVHIARLQERDRTLFERVVSAQMAKDTSRAAMYANEVAEIRKMSKQLIMTQIALEQVQLRLETVSEISEVFVNLIPVVGVVNELKSVLKGVMPEISLELSSLSEDLQTVVIEAGDFAGGYSYTSAATPEARKILDEASAIAEQRMKEKFPDLPVNALAQRA